MDIIIYEPTARYQNVAKRQGEEKPTPPWAMIAELVRRYWVLGMECSLLKIQKLAWFLDRVIDTLSLKNPLNLHFQANNYDPKPSCLTPGLLVLPLSVSTGLILTAHLYLPDS